MGILVKSLLCRHFIAVGAALSMQFFTLSPIAALAPASL
jgi:hypothetical protein